MTPAQIRKSVREQRRVMDTQLREILSRKICDRIDSTEDFRCAERMGGFLAFDGEVDLSIALSKAMDRGQKVFLPIVRGKKLSMSFAPYCRSTKLVENRFGILEPDVSDEHCVDAALLDFVLTPMVAFDERCHRIGVGGGFYDRTFAFKRLAANNQRPKMIGVAFEFQKIAAISPQSWDVALDAVVTETTVYHRVSDN